MASPLNLPREIEVRADRSGEPLALRLDRAWKRVTSIHNTWRIDDEWWREEIVRRYFEVELEGGPPLTVFLDLVSGKWYSQRC